MPELVHVHRYVYTLNELDEQARRNAIDILIDQAWETLPSEIINEMIYDQFCKKAGREDLRDGNQEASVKKLGITIGWSVAYTQSDGVELNGRICLEDFPGFSTYGPLTWPKNVTMIEISNGRLFSQAYDDEATDRIAKGIDNYSREWTQSMDFVKGLQHDLYWYARHVVDEMMQESAIIEHYQAQLYPRRFTEDGRLAPSDFWEKAHYVEPVVIQWNEHDVASLLKAGDDTAPDLDKARDILVRVSKHLKDRSIELGWEVLETLVAEES